jgi:uncharacterized membrane protein YphA (DoxX/SURF4 family)
MNTLATILQIIIALGIVNVWLLRFGGSTEWRGGSAQNMTEEFSVYGLPAWFMRFVGFLKISLAVLLIVGVWVPDITRYAAFGMVTLMIGAVAMHAKVGDPLRKSLPAISMLTMSAVVALIA